MLTIQIQSAFIPNLIPINNESYIFKEHPGSNNIFKPELSNISA